jgi:hypothetical protein
MEEIAKNKSFFSGIIYVKLRICQISKYFKDTLKVNKSVKTTLDVK